MYKNFVRVVERTNVVINNYATEDIGVIPLKPSLGNVAFGSGKHQWGFTLTRFADMYSKKFGIDKEKMMSKLWGDNFFDPKAKLWKTDKKSKDGKKILKRTFVQFILDPILKIAKACMTDDDKTVKTLL